MSETCSGTNGEYYTHPAFTFGEDELEGIWVGKFEVSNTTDEIKIKPNVSSLRNQTLTSFYSAIKDMQKSGNIYGLNTDTSVVDSHMMKNMEWGAVTYLMHSGYGKCTENTCTKIGINNNQNFITGCGAVAGSGSSDSCNQYSTEDGMQASTTGNIYGVYDMSGGSWEYVMGNMSGVSGSYTYNASSGGSNFNYSSETAKYIDTYANGSTIDDQTAYNRGKLGDATSEIVVSANNGWFNNCAYFVYSTNSWFGRGGGYGDGDNAIPFYFNKYVGDINSGISTHGVIMVLE